MRPIVPQPIQTPRAPKEPPKAIESGQVKRVTERQGGGGGAQQDQQAFRRRNEPKARPGSGAAHAPGASLALTLALLTLDALPVEGQDEPEDRSFATLIDEAASEP
jgi:hypothetical protein